MCSVRLCQHPELLPGSTEKLFNLHSRVTAAQDMLGTEEETFSASRLLLISAPSRRVWRSALDVSAPLSFPARSMRENFPCIFPRRRRMIWNTAWLREEWAFAEVWPEVLKETQGQRKRTLFLRTSAFLSNIYNIHYTILKLLLLPQLYLHDHLLPAAVSHFDEFQNVLCAFHLPLLQAHHLHLLLPVLQDP